MTAGETINLTDRQAFAAMRLFLDGYQSRTGGHFPTLMADTYLEADGMTHDPAAWSDWLICVRSATGCMDGGSAKPG